MMDLIRRPSSTLGLSTFEEMDKLFDNFWRTFNLPSTTFGLPSVDIYSEDDKHMVVEMQAPGFDQDDIDISVRDSVLEIRGEKTAKEEHNDKKRSYMVRESTASFARRVVLPEGADANNITAELDKGVLRVTVPVDRPKAKRIQISASKAANSKSLTTKTE
jgi:HSP20 family protein